MTEDIARRPTKTLAERLDEAQERWFVGRRAELEQLRAALANEGPPVLFFHGPGGIGKSELLGRAGALARARGRSVVRIDGQLLDPSPAAVLRAVGPLEAGAVLLIDTFERLEVIASWFQRRFLPGLPGDAVVIIAGRRPPSADWTSDPGWRETMLVRPLRNLSAETAREYLERRGVHPDRFAAILAFTHGHPLALALCADTSDAPADPDEARDVIRNLVTRFRDGIDAAEHALALECAALLRITTEPLLEAMTERTNCRDLFDWLDGLSFMARCRDGLQPHDLVRDTLARDLRWRAPERFAQLHDRARRYLAGRLEGLAFNTPGATALMEDMAWLHRPNHDAMAPWHAVSDTGLVLDRPGPDDLAAARSWLVSREGEPSARWLDYWAERQPTALIVLRNADEEPVSLGCMLVLDRETGPRSDDPGVRAVWQAVERWAPLRAGEVMLFSRIWLARDTYQAVSPVQAAQWLHSIGRYLRTPGLAVSCLAFANVGFYQPVFEYMNFHRLDADFRVGDHQFGVMAHDWRGQSVYEWLGFLADRQLTPNHAPPPERSVVALDRDTFAEAVRTALKEFESGIADTNPLLRSRLTEAGGDDLSARRRCLEALLREAAEGLRETPTGNRHFRALSRTWLDPVGTQRQAAERLGVPFSTYRRHLTQALEQVTEALWRLELG